MPKTSGAVACPKCRTQNNVSRYHAGAKVPCTKCKAIIVVPGAKPGPAPAPEPEEAPAAPQSAPSRKGSPPSKAGAPPVKKHGPNSRVPAPPKDRMTPLMRTAMKAGPPGGVPVEPTSSVGRSPRRGKRQEGNSAMIIGGIVGALGLVLAIAYMMTGNEKEESKKFKGAQAKAPAAAGGETPATPAQAEPAKAPAEPPKADPVKPQPPKAQPASPKPAAPARELVVSDAGEQMIWDLLDNIKGWPTAKIETAKKNILQFPKNDFIPSLIKALTEVDDFKALKAEEFLREVTGKTFGWSPTSTIEERRSVQEKWKSWWLDGAAAPDAGPKGAEEPAKRPPAGVNLAGADPAFERELDGLLPNYTKSTFDDRERVKGKVKKQGKAGIQSLIKKLYDAPEVEIAEGAADLLLELTEQKFGRYPRSNNDDAQAYADKWSNWWKESKDSFQMPE
ncbi:MAG: hypothetical protein HYZ53_11075 [Planctomycetes bacterium]|nr:hypothetical protein [Planctomycetota bacterium]